MPTRNGRNAMLFTTKGIINIDNEKWKKDFSPIDDGLNCEISNFYSKAYLRHLVKSKEILGLQVASIHNLAFYLDIVTKARQHIFDGTFLSWKKEMVLQWATRL
jgi:queuine tRNA-ribosyltransferase